MDANPTDDSYTTIHLNKDWSFRQADDPASAFVPTQGFPTEIHLDLLHHGIILDLFLGKQERDIQWVGEKPWLYQTKFSTPSNLCNRSYRSVFVVFEGLDTYATVSLNGKIILESDDMFLPARVNVSEYLNDHEENVLEILFESAYLIGKKVVEKHPDHKWGCWNGDPSRLAVRKAQYHWSWDWGPCCLTCGPWKPIYLEVFQARIVDLYFRTDLDESLDSATVNVEMDYEGYAGQVRFDVSVDGEQVASSIELLKSHRAKAMLWTRKPKLWYPRRYGKQPLYVLTATLFADKDGETIMLHQVTKRFGIRRAKVVQRELLDAPGSTFYFEINNVPVFCGGSNWIPAHNFQTLLTSQNYHTWVKLATDSNQVMLRVWGGGIYEQDAFYEACDELGVLVWQDFAFACGNYPAADAHFRHLVEKEAVASVKRLRHHPCIVIWAGNNEDYQYQESENLDYDPADRDPNNWLESSFPARYIYEKLLKDVTSELVPDTYYHFGSPYSGHGKATTDATLGDIHQWNVWHGSQSSYQDFDKLSGRFVSEFGMEAYPAMETVDECLTEGKEDIDRFPQSSTVEFHNKAAGSERRLALYLAENIRYSLEPFEHYVYCTQLIQAEAIATAYRLWKRQWKGPGREYCAGALVWQLNDCWPAISWSIVDHYLRPKLAYYAVKREMEPLTIGMKRIVHEIPEDKYTRAYVKIVHELELWVCNLSLEECTTIVKIKSYTFSGEASSKNERRKQDVTDIATVESQKPVTILSNRSTELKKFHVPVSRENSGEAAQTVVYATLLNPHNNTIIARAFNWPEPLKHVHLSRPKHLRLSLSMGDAETKSFVKPYSTPPDWWCPPNNVCMLFITSDVPLKGVQIEVEDIKNVCFEDQGFDVMADETFAVKVWGLSVEDEDQVTIRHLGV